MNDKDIEDMTTDELRDFVVSYWSEALKKSIFDGSHTEEDEERLKEAFEKAQKICSPSFPWKNLGERVILTLKCPEGMSFKDFVEIVEEVVNEFEKEKNHEQGT